MGTCDGALATACATTEYVKSNKCEKCPNGHTCDGALATACATTKYVLNNKCMVCPTGSTCDGTKATVCSAPNYVEANACMACPSGSTCDGTIATACATTEYVKSNKCEECPSGHTCDGASATVCAASDYIESNQCKSCPSGASCDGTSVKWSVNSGDAIYLQSPSHDDQYVECHGGAGEGYGVSTTPNKDGQWKGIPTTRFTIHKWTGNGAIFDGDAVYLQSPSHDDQYVECHGGAGEGYGVSTTPNKEGQWKGIPTTQFTIHKWSGNGAIFDDDAVYLQSPSHDDQYVECHGGAGEGSDVSTTPNKDGQWKGIPTTQFTIHKW